MKVNRRDLLQMLLAVEPGLSRKDSILGCVILRRGRFYTFNHEISCSIKSTLAREVDAVVDGYKLLEVLRQLPDKELELKVGAKHLNLKGNQRSVRMPLMDVESPVNLVERPKEWQPLHEDFGAFVDLAHGCTTKKKEFANACIHLAPKFLEASDNICAIRCLLLCPVKRSVLVRSESLVKIAQLSMTQAAETQEWLHFKNPLGLRFSLRKIPMEEGAYPPLEKFLKLRGRHVSLSKDLAKVAKRAGLFADGEGRIEVQITKGHIIVKGVDTKGEYEEIKVSEHNGTDLGFKIGHKVLEKVAQKHTDCEITDVTMRLVGDGFTFAASLDR